MAYNLSLAVNNFMDSLNNDYEFDRQGDSGLQNLNSILRGVVSLPPIERSYFDRYRWQSLNSLLSEKVYYPFDSSIVSYCQGIVDHMLEPGEERIHVVVVHDDDENAFATPDLIVINDGLLKALNHDENENMSAHELIHILKGHHSMGIKKGVISSVGSQRTHEVEADLIGMIERVDAKGGNPYGMISLFKTLRGSTAGHGNDVIHGTLLDRILNIDEILRYIDVRNLSLDMKPSPLQAEDFTGYYSDEFVEANYDRMDIFAKRHYLAKLVKKAETEADFAVLGRRQEALFAQLAPDLPRGELEIMTIIALINGYDCKYKDFLDEWCKWFDSPEKVKMFARLRDHSAFEQLGIRSGGSSLSNKVLVSFLEGQENLDIVGYFDLIGSFRKPDASDLAMLAEVLVKRGMVKQAVMDQLFEIIIDKGLVNIHVADIVSILKKHYKIDERVEQEISYKRKELDNYRYEELKEDRIKKTVYTLSEYQEFAELAERIDKQIFSSIVSIKDPLELVDAFYTKISDSQIEYIDKLQALFVSKTRAVSDAQLIDMITEFANRQNTELYSVLSFIADLYSSSYQENEDGDSIMHFEDPDLDDRFLLLAISSYDRSVFLENINKCLAQVYRGDDFSEVASDLGNPDKSNLIRHIGSMTRLLDKIKLAFDRSKEFGFHKGIELSLANIADDLGIYDAYVFSKLNKVTDKHGLVDIFRDMQPYNLQLLTEPVWERLNVMALEGVETLEDIKDFDTLEALLAVSCVAPNTSVLLQVPAKIALEMVRRLSFKNGLHFVFEEYEKLPRHVFSQALDYLIEERDLTLDELESLDKYVSRDVVKFFENDEAIGKAAIADALLDSSKTMGDHTQTVAGRKNTIEHVDPNELLEALLESGTNDRALKDLLFKRWWTLYRLRGAEGRNENISKFFNVEDIAYMRQADKKARRDHWMKELPKPGSYQAFIQSLSTLFLPSVSMRYAALRKILTGQGGVLATQDNKMRLLDSFLQRSIQFEGHEREEGVTRQLLEAFLTVGEEEELYPLLNGLLMELILQPTTNKFSISTMASRQAYTALMSMPEVLKMSSDNPNSWRPDEIEWFRAVSTKILGLMTAGGRYKEDVETSPMRAKLIKLFNPEEKRVATEKMTPWQLVSVAGSKLGTLGILMKQRLWRYFKLPEEVRQDFLNSHDNVRGQTRLQAYRTLKREAQHSPEIANMMGNVLQVSPRRGGGKLFTVFEVVMKTGEREAVAVRNPNVEYHLGKQINLFRKTIAAVRQKSPDNRIYKLLEVLLGDVENTILSEIHDPHFEVNDANFRQLNDFRYGKYKSKHRYGVLVPDSKATGSRWIRRDAFVDGKNLTSLKVTEGATDIRKGLINQEDYKRAIATLVDNYLYQINDATLQDGTGLIHSDMHPGNARITFDNNLIAIFDRYNLISLNQSDRKFIKGLATGFLMGKVFGSEVANVRSRFVDYLLDLPENRSIAGNKKQILQSLGQTDAKNLEEIMSDSVVALKSMEIFVPSKITDIAENLQSLNNMARQAGFANIMEAYKYR
jgi:hypothetical protein